MVYDKRYIIKKLLYCPATLDTTVSTATPYDDNDNGWNIIWSHLVLFLEKTKSKTKKKIH